MTRPTLTGIMPLRNAARLGYPFRIAIRSLQRACDDVLINVDPTSDDSTMADVQALCADPVNGTPTRILESVWDMGNHDGHRNCEISVQTQKLCDAAAGDWIFSIQADEVIHEDHGPVIRAAIESAETWAPFGESHPITGINGQRIYFYGGLDVYRIDWTIGMVRLFKRGHWRPDVDGAMRFDPVDGKSHPLTPNDPPVTIYHYSRVGDPAAIARRVRNLDTFFHDPASVMPEDAVTPYDFSELRKLDTYRIGATIEADPNARLVPFDVRRHPAEIMEFYGVTP